MAQANIHVWPSELTAILHHSSSILNHDRQFLVAKFGGAVEFCVCGSAADVVEFTKQLAAYAITAFGEAKPWGVADLDIVEALDVESERFLDAVEAYHHPEDAGAVLAAAQERDPGARYEWIATAGL